MLAMVVSICILLAAIEGCGPISGGAAMKAALRDRRPLFRVWIVRYERWRPAAWDELPPRATAVEPADGAAMSAREAVRFLEGFNRTMLARVENAAGESDDSLSVWAVAIPVSIRYDGD